MKRILVIDPTHSYLEDLKSVCDSHLLELKWTKKGQTALEILQKQSFDVIFIELTLSDMDGRDVIAKINEMKIDTTQRKYKL